MNKLDIILKKLDRLEKIILGQEKKPKYNLNDKVSYCEYHNLMEGGVVVGFEHTFNGIGEYDYVYQIYNWEKNKCCEISEVWINGKLNENGK